jgi:hypothetical protein
MGSRLSSFSVPGTTVSLWMPRDAFVSVPGTVKERRATTV